MTTERPIIQTRGLTKVFGSNGTAVHLSLITHLTLPTIYSV